ncbi:hypothetical protein [Haloferula sp. BvORR071]|uniref:hypothetical protein n=1 Tax=Haloferula sp. BvORR071 TaxID=1396141 RepID=UPI000557232F|nr:hypothetical protein [Haloferula sp. BvORR071]
MTTSTSHDPVEVPLSPAARWVEILLWVFMASFALDYRNAIARESGAGAGLDQLVFLALAMSSTAGILWFGWRYLLVRPGAWLILFWGGFLAFMAANSLLQGVQPARSIRIILPLCLCFAGMMNAHIASCVGVRPSRIVMPVFAAACTNIVWRIFQGFVFKGVTFDTARTEVQSAANNWLAAWIGCAMLLRSRFHWLLPLAVGVLFFGIFITVTRSLLFPVMASAAASSLCFVLGTRWGIYQPIDALKRMAPLVVLGGLAAIAIAGLFVAQPHQIERWNERLFHHASDRNTTEDISYLTRRAEADGIFEILNRDPVHYLFGKGIGASYYWHSQYMPAIHLVYPPSEEIGDDVWFAGHSTWTYSLFSGGVIGLLAHLGLIGGVMAASLLAARSNASDPGPDQWLAFLPFVAACCLLSESLTSNPFDERLAAMIFGVMAGLSQSFLVRASWIHAGLRAPRS